MFEFCNRGVARFNEIHLDTVDHSSEVTRVDRELRDCVGKSDVNARIGGSGRCFFQAGSQGYEFIPLFGDGTGAVGNVVRSAAERVDGINRTALVPWQG